MLPLLFGKTVVNVWHVWYDCASKLIKGRADMSALKTIIHDLSDEEFEKLGFSPEEYMIIPAREKAAFCQGCFGCWMKTPGKCVYKDRLQYIGTVTANSEKLIIISRCCYGGYSPEIKRVFDRAISESLPFFTYRAWRIHHPSRYKNRPALSVYLYGDISDYEKEVAARLVRANAVNMNCRAYEHFFAESAEKLAEVTA